MSRFVVVTPWRCHYPDPIEVAAGDVVVTGRADQDPHGWRGWIWCRHPGTGRAGWIPERLLERTDPETGRLLEDYVARELDVETGDLVLRVSDQWFRLAGRRR